MKKIDCPTEIGSCFEQTLASLSSCATLSVKATFCEQLEPLGEKPRMSPRNHLMGTVYSRTSTGDLGIEVVFWDIYDNCPNGDFYVYLRELRVLLKLKFCETKKQFPEYKDYHRGQKNYLL